MLSRVVVILALIGLSGILPSVSAQGILLPDNVVKKGNINLTTKTATVITSVNLEELQRLLQGYLDQLGVITPPARVITGRRRRDLPGKQPYQLTGTIAVYALDD